MSRSKAAPFPASRLRVAEAQARVDQRDHRLRELYRLQEAWARRAAAGDEAAERIARAIEALIIEYELARLENAPDYSIIST